MPDDPHHPAIIAQAAATSAVMLEGRFNLGVGTGEALNEHVTGAALARGRRAPGDARGGGRGHPHALGGRAAQPPRAATTPSRTRAIYDLPDAPPPILVSGFGPKAIDVAARIGDGFVTTSPDADGIGQYRAGGGTGPVHAGTKVCFMADADEARRTVHRLWPNEALPGELAQILPTPSHFEQACELVTPDMLSTPVGPDIDEHVAALQAFADAGVDELYVSQIGPDQDAFFERWAPAVLPRFA